MESFTFMGLSIEALIGIALIVLLLFISGIALANMHIANNDVLIRTNHLVDSPDPWRTGKPDRAHRRRNKRKK